MITTVVGRPLKGEKLQLAKEFLGRLSLSWEEGIETTVLLLEDGKVIGTGSREKNVLKCIGVSCKFAGEGLSAQIMTELVKDAHVAGYSHLFLYTKPSNIVMFQDFGFHPIAETSDILLMENKRKGIETFVSSLKNPHAQGQIGGIVANCNPFTNGHRFLMEYAASRCDFLYVFILSENRSFFSTEVRTQLAKEGTAHIPNLQICPTGDYLVSSATFPQYFLHHDTDIEDAHCQLDVQLFGNYFAKELGITSRYVGTEPFSPVTKAYNETMKELLPSYGVEVVELPRTEIDGTAVSASQVRKLLKEEKWEEIRPLVPPTTFAYLEKQYGI